MTLEHIWPQALGGQYAPDLFRTREVCERCNSLAGQWVDGAFLKSWLIICENAIAARHFLEPAVPGILPLIYFGIDEGFPVQPGEVCERWIGPAGEQIYYVHQADDNKWFGYAGGDFIRRNQGDAGRAYIGLTASHDYWALTGLQSFIADLEPARLFTVTICESLPDYLMQRLTPEAQATPIEAAELAWIRNRPSGRSGGLRASLRVDFSDRFLAKLALGLGYNIIGRAFRDSSYAEELRKLLWRRDPSQDEGIEVFGTSYWQASQFSAVSHMIGLTGAWTIMLQALREGLSVSVCTPLGRLMTIAISKDPSLLPLSAIDQYYLGALYFAVPQRRTFLGPVALPAYLAHRNGSHVVPAIAKLEALRVEPSMLAPRQWPGAVP
jgi:hypothetical protein